MLSIRDASLRFGDRTLWSHLDLDVRRGEFIALLGANGSGKTTLLRAILGQQALSSGEIMFLGEPVRHGDRRIGLVPQQGLGDATIPMRARDLVALGLDGHRWGLPLPSPARRRTVDRVLDEIGATPYAQAPVGILSGGERQRLRVGQALIGDPDLLLCDEPLASLDLARQKSVSSLIDQQRRSRNVGVIFVTHDINPVLRAVDRVLYLAEGSFRIGTPDEVMRTDVLSELYGSHVDVIRSHGRLIVVGAQDHFEVSSPTEEDR